MHGISKRLQTILLIFVIAPAMPLFTAFLSIGVVQLLFALERDFFVHPSFVMTISPIPWNVLGSHFCTYDNDL